MYHRKLLLILMISTTSAVVGQSLLDVYGFGRPLKAQAAATSGTASSGLLPGFQNGISLSNPATWSNLSFSYISGSYAASRFELTELEIIQESSTLSQFSFIVPIKGRFAWGLGLNPFAAQNISLVGLNTEQFNYEGEPYELRKSIKATGGVYSLNSAFGFPLGTFERGGISFDFLFGSTRHETTLSVNSINYLYQRRHIYSGTLAKIFLSTSRFSESKIPVELYTSIGLAVMPLRIRSLWYEPFEDINESGDQDNSDFPTASNAQPPLQKYVNDIIKPFEFEIGVDIKLNQIIYLQSAASFWRDNSKVDSEVLIFDDWLKSQSHFSVGIVKYQRRGPKTILDYSILRLGLYGKFYDFELSDDIKMEYGLSLGVGFNFGLTKNQIDISYLVGKRERILGVSEEIIQQISIGISLGDLWFEKRRIH
ncbi:MAG: hypothetical protein V3U16_01095 [Candidatus Neomarinimicrobiota bacterium]